MSELVQVRKKGHVTLPQSVRKELGIEEGDFLAFQSKSGEIVLKVKKLVDKERVWFNTNCWQQEGKDTKQDIQLGTVHNFHDSKKSANPNPHALTAQEAELDYFLSLIATIAMRVTADAEKNKTANKSPVIDDKPQ